MVTPLTWTSYLDTIARLAVVEPDNVDYLALAPQMVNYAELRICRDLDFLSTVTSVPGFSMAAAVRSLSFPIDTFIVLENVNVVAATGALRPLTASTKEYLTAVYDSAASAALPRYFAMLDQNTLLFGPWPDQDYPVELVGTTRPVSLSLANPTTFIATYLPDLFIMASMVWISGYQRNFGRQSDDPQQAMSYEAQYMTLLKGAMVEEARKKFEAAAWSPMPPSPVASPSRQAAG